MRRESLLRLVETAVLLAVGTVLSLIQFPKFWVHGGSVTLASMLPIVLLAHRWGTPWGLFSGLLYALLQMALGFANVQYASSALMAFGIVLLDYVLPFTLIGLSAVFNPILKRKTASIAAGVCFTFFLRFVCHFASGVFIWDALYPNDLGMFAPLYSLLYNGSYMLPEILVTLAVALGSFSLTRRFWEYQGTNIT